MGTIRRLQIWKNSYKVKASGNIIGKKAKEKPHPANSRNSLNLGCCEHKVDL